MGGPQFDQLRGRMLLAISLLCLLAGGHAAPGPRFTCSECVKEMHGLGWLIHAGADDIQAYLIANYCPTLEHGSHFCEEDLSGYYIGMLSAIVQHFFVDG